MNGLLAVWNGLDASRRLALVGAVVATVTALTYMANAVRTPHMALLYAGLEPGVAGEVITALERMNIASQVDGDAIYVPQNVRDSVRMALARDGLPAQSQAGYELLDQLNGFSTTSEMFDAAYWRAKEGELGRTILSVPGVRTARVHIGAAKRNPFDAKADANSAVVTVNMGRGPLGKQQALSIRYLVALAISGLPAEKVAVIDAERGVVLRPGDGAPEAEAMTMANDRERDMERRLRQLLEARVGAGAARVSVSLELDMESEAMSERILDPDSRVTRGRETTDVTQNSSGSSSGVTVASNLPEGDASSGNNSSSQRNEARERIDYDFSEITRQKQKTPGAIKKVSVAVLVDAVRSVADDGTINREARSKAEINSLRELVQSAIGFDEARGDVVTVETLEFQELPDEGVTVEASPFMRFIENNIMGLIKIIIPSIVTLILGLFVVKPLVASAQNNSAGSSSSANEEEEDFLPPPMEFAPMEDMTAELEGPQDSLEKLKEIAADKQEETAALIKTWLDREEEPA
ncbi:MAG: flagellar basal-body MS-ring/collar protein FliF [Pseudomonadota bacterium]